MTKIYVVTAISSCDNAYEGELLALDEQYVFTDKEAAKKKLTKLYDERAGYEGEYGEVVDSYIDDTDFEVVLEDENSTIIYQGEIKEYEV